MNRAARRAWASCRIAAPHSPQARGEFAQVSQQNRKYTRQDTRRASNLASNPSNRWGAAYMSGLVAHQPSNAKPRVLIGLLAPMLYACPAPRGGPKLSWTNRSMGFESGKPSPFGKRLRSALALYAMWLPLGSTFAAALDATPASFSLGRLELVERELDSDFLLDAATGRLQPLKLMSIQRPVPTPMKFEGPKELFANPTKRNTCAQQAKRVLAYWSDRPSAGFQAAVFDHAKDCMAVTRPLDGMLGGVDTAVLLRSIGAVAAMIHDVPEVFCTAMSIDGETVLTARHCFADPQGEVAVGFNPRTLLSECVISPATCRLVFIPADAPDQRIAFKGPEQAMPGEIARASDQVYLELASARSSVPRVEFTVPVVNQAALLVGPVQHLVASATEPVDTHWQRGADFLPCGFSAVGTHTASHVCQSWPGFSGAPLVIATRRVEGIDVAVVAGIHLGGAEARDTEFQGPSSALPGFDMIELVNVALRGDAITNGE